MESEISERSRVGIRKFWKLGVGSRIFYLLLRNPGLNINLCFVSKQLNLLHVLLFHTSLAELTSEISLIVSVSTVDIST